MWYAECAECSGCWRLANLTQPAAATASPPRPILQAWPQYCLPSHRPPHSPPVCLPRLPPLQAFAAPERVAELVARVRGALHESLPSAVGKMQLYLTNPSTHAILFKPIKSNVAEAHGQIAALLEGEYTAEEVAAIGLTPAADLAALLDSLS